MVLCSHFFRTKYNPTLAKSRRQGWSSDIESSADDGQTVVGNVVPDVVGKADGLTIKDG